MDRTKEIRAPLVGDLLGLPPGEVAEQIKKRRDMRKGQDRRAWLDEKLQAGDETLRHYLGPTGVPDKLQAIVDALTYTDAGDMQAATDASRELWNNPSIGAAADMTAAGVALALPMYSARMGEAITDMASDAVRAYDPSVVRSIGGGPDDYRGVHRAPGFSDDGTTASLDALDAIYPDDIYDRRVAARYYGHMEDAQADQEMIDLFARLRGRPDVGVPMYRAVPKDAPDEIAPGDWVTPSRRYAESHGESALGGDYKIVEGNAPASELFTDANSIFEFGWSPRQAPETPAQEVARLLREGRASEVTDDMMAQVDPQEMARLYETGATGVDMPMDEASRMARAKEMGFDTETPLYHGTGTDIRAFQASPARSWMNPPGVYLAGDGPNGSGAIEASGYASEATGGAPSVIPVMDRASEGVSYGISDGGYQSISDRQSSVIANNGLKWSQGQEIWDGVTDATKTDAYFDAATPADFQRGTYSKRVVLDPTNIRSRFARFDPRLKHLANLSAGVGGIGLLLGQQSQQDPNNQEEMLAIKHYLDGLN